MAGKKAQKPSYKPGTLMTILARRGPHRVLRGDLDIVGMKGQVFTPEQGDKLPAVAFGHAWLAGSPRYRDLLFHLASWGIVVVVPDGHRGPAPSDAGLAGQMRSSLDLVSRASLGFGDITVDPDKLGFVGHGFGAAAATFAASADTVRGQPPRPVKGVLALFPAPTTRDEYTAAATVTAPTLILASATEVDTVAANALPLAAALGGDVSLRVLAGATSRGLLERRSLKSLVGINGAERPTHALVRAAAVGFLLASVGDDPEYQAFLDPDATLGKLTTIDLDDPPDDGLDHASRLLGAKPSKRSTSRR